MKSEIQQIRYSLGGSLTPVVRVLLWINGLVFAFLWIASGHSLSGILPDAQVDAQSLLVRLLGLVPLEVTHDLALWQPLTYMFVHTSGMHLLMNMLGLWWFGAEVERFFGAKLFWRYYLVTGIGGALAAIAISWSSQAVTIGASGAVFGLLVAYGFLFPDRTLMLYFVIPVRAKYCVLVFAGITVYMLFSGSNDGVSHIAHFGGMVFGLLWFAFFKGRSRFAEALKFIQRRRLRRKLRLISRNRKDGDGDGPVPYDNNTVH